MFRTAAPLCLMHVCSMNKRYFSVVVRIDYYFSCYCYKFKDLRNKNYIIEFSKAWRFESGIFYNNYCDNSEKEEQKYVKEIKY